MKKFSHTIRARILAKNKGCEKCHYGIAESWRWEKFGFETGDWGEKQDHRQALCGLCFTNPNDRYEIIYGRKPGPLAQR